jgi:hypothetical protein
LVFGFPAHGGGNAGAAARMVEKEKFFERRGVEFAVFTEQQGRLGEAIGLAGGIQSKDIGFILRDANEGVLDGRGEERYQPQN